jgi:hypothetical protein
VHAGDIEKDNLGFEEENKEGPRIVNMYSVPDVAERDVPAVGATSIDSEYPTRYPF